MDDPSNAGLTIIGAFNVLNAFNVSATLVTSTQEGVGRLLDCQIFLVIILFIAILDAMTPEPV